MCNSKRQCHKGCLWVPVAPVAERLKPKQLEDPISPYERNTAHSFSVHLLHWHDLQSHIENAYTASTLPPGFDDLNMLEVLTNLLPKPRYVSTIARTRFQRTGNYVMKGNYPSLPN